MASPARAQAPRRGAEQIPKAPRWGGGEREQMTVEENVNIVKQGDEAFQSQDRDRFVNLHAESVVINSPSLSEPIKGRQALREFVK